MNSYEVAHCLECRQPLPWGATVEKYSSQMNAARDAVQQLRSQVQQLQAQPATAPPTTQRVPFNGTSVPVPPPPPPAYAEASRAVPVTYSNKYHAFLAAVIGETGAGFFDEMNDDQARIAGLLLAGVWNLCLLVGSWLILRNVATLLSTFMSGFLGSAVLGQSSTASVSPFGGGILVQPPTPEPFSMSFRVALEVIAVATFAWGVLVGLCALVRTIGRGDGSFAGDLLTASASLIPGALFWLLAGLLGLGNYNVVAALAIFALVYGVVLMHRGLTMVSGVASSVATLCIPFLFLIDSFAVKVIVTRLVSP